MSQFDWSAETPGWWVFDAASGVPKSGPWLCEIEAKVKAKQAGPSAGFGFWVGVA